SEVSACDPMRSLAITHRGAVRLATVAWLQRSRLCSPAWALSWLFVCAGRKRWFRAQAGAAGEPLRGEPCHSALGAVGRFEEAVLDVVAWLQAEALGGAAGKFKARPDITARGDDILRQWLGAGLDAVHRAVGADEHHVERNVGVAHPHGNFLRRVI